MEEASLVQGAVARGACPQVYQGMRHATAGDNASAALRGAIVDFQAQATAWEAAPEESPWAHCANAVAAHTRLCDLSYLDDGIVCLRSRLAVPYLRTFDKDNLIHSAKGN